MIRYVIIGTGAAGIAAAQTIRTLDQYCEIYLVAAEVEGYYSRPSLAYYLNKEVNKNSLFPFNNNDFKNLGLQIIFDKAESINPATQEIALQSGQIFPYDKLLVATGASAIPTNVDGGDLEGVYYLDSLYQTNQIIKKSRRAKKAIVIGGGITALEFVEGLLARKMEVHFFLRGDRYWNRVLDPLESGIILNRLVNEGVIIHKKTEIKRIIGKNGKVSKVSTTNGDILPVDLIGVAIGVRPRIDLAKTAEIETNRGIKINQYMETSQKYIYAAGDVAEIQDPESGASIVDSLWPIARHQGVIAGMNMAGKKQIYERKSPMNVTRLAGLTTTIIGHVGNALPSANMSIVRGESEAWQMMPDAVICQNNFEVNRLRLMLGIDHILGAVVMGDQSLSQIIENVIRNQIPIHEIRDDLLRPNTNITQVLLNFMEKRKLSDEN